MPKLAGVNLAGVLLATIAAYFVGYIWYGLVFQLDWLTEIMRVRGLSADQLATMDAAALGEALAATNPSANMGLYMGFGFFLTLLTVFVLAIVLKAFAATGVVQNLGRAALVCVGFAIPMLANDVVYGLEPLKLFYIDASYALASYLVPALILSFFD
ncbi:MAG: DUF1761 domain-containing protein [Pseudomonadota bacterium]